MAGAVVILKPKREDSGGLNRLVIESGNENLPEGGAMSKNEEREVVREQHPEQHPEDADEVEAHSFREAHAERAEEDREAKTEAPDFEAHRKSH
jgi:hypothetical protein